jgi:hypothetical protein
MTNAAFRAKAILFLAKSCFTSSMISFFLVLMLVYLATGKFDFLLAMTYAISLGNDD